MKRMCVCIIGLLIIYSQFIYCAPRLSVDTKALYTQEQSVKHKPHTKGEPLRILFVVDGFPHFDQPFILDQILGVMNHGHEVYIAAKSEVKNSIIPAVVEEYDLMERTLFFGNANPLKLLQNHPKIPHINTFDVICCQFGNIGADIIRFKRKVSPIPAKIITCWRGAAKEALMKPYEYAALFKYGDLFLPVCEFLKRDIVGLGCNPRKIQVLYIGINHDCYTGDRTHKNNTIHLMSICRLVEKKGIAYAIHAVASLVPLYPNIRYTIIGDGPLKEDFKSLAVELHMQDHIEFIDNQPHEKIPEFLRKADIFLSPSITTAQGNQEGIANSLKEAMASGVLAIATDHAGTDELIEDGVSGWLVPERNVELLAEKIDYLITHPEIWDGMRNCARQRIHERFCLSESIEQFIAIIEGICVH